MSSRIKLRWFEPTNKFQLELRRYNNENKKNPCPGTYKYHTASVLVGEKEMDSEYEGYGRFPRDFPKTDPRWPTKCDYCDYLFNDKDEWQENAHRVYKCANTGEEFNNANTFTISNLPPGSIYRVKWYEKEDRKKWVGPDGRSLCLILPDKTPWMIDGPSTNGNGWTRTGKPEDGTLDVKPSILTSGYHGFVNNGWLEEC